MLATLITNIRQWNEYVYQNTIKRVLQPWLEQLEILKLEGLNEKEILNLYKKVILDWLYEKRTYLFGMLLIVPYLILFKLKCFYCNKNTYFAIWQKVNKDIFVCQYCNATNFMGESGRIVDYNPVMSKDREESFTKQIHKKESTQESFCNECYQNLQYRTKSLADYLPSDDDPNFPSRLLTLEQHKTMLEVHHPIGCNKCKGYQKYLKRYKGT